TSYFAVVASTWNFAGLSKSTPIEFEIPNRSGATFEISGRSANAHNQESAFDLNPLTRWQVGGSGTVDLDTPPEPSFGLNPAGQGTIELVGIGFPTLTNTHSIVAGTLALFSWNELNAPTAFSLASSV